VDADESEREVLVSRSGFRERDMAACRRAVLRVKMGSLERSLMVDEVGGGSGSGSGRDSGGSGGRARLGSGGRWMYAAAVGG
jgi:hypothetical protein